MKLTRLNGDSSWLLQLDSLSLLIDPWLYGSQTDLAAWFSRQWHTEKCVSVDQLPQIDAILISHPFTDHCHKETLLKFSSDIPVLAAPAAARKIRSWKHFQTLHELDSNKSFGFESLELQYFPSGRFLDPVHAGLLFKGENKSLFYAPHGFSVSNADKPGLKNIDVLISTSLHYKLPFFLGGTINMGLENARDLARLLHAKHFVPTHDENKKAIGLVNRLANKTRPSALQDAFADIPGLQAAYCEIADTLEF